MDPPPIWGLTSNGITPLSNGTQPDNSVIERLQPSSRGLEWDRNDCEGSMTFFRLLKLTEQGIQALRNQQETMSEIAQIITDNGGKLVGAWFTQGDYDMISIIQAEDDKAMRTISARLAVKGLYTGKTLPAMPLNDFMKRFGDGPEVAMFLETWFRAGRKDKRR